MSSGEHLAESGLEGVEGIAEAQQHQRAARAQARPLAKEQRGPACPRRWRAPARPFHPFQPQADPQLLSARQWGAARRDTGLSPGSPELGASSFCSDIIGIDGKKQESQESPSSLRASPGRNEHSPSPTAFALLPAPRVTMATTVTSR